MGGRPCFGLGKMESRRDVQGWEPDLPSLQRLRLSPRPAFLCHQRATPPPASLLRAFCVGKLEMGLNRAPGLGHLQTRRKPETGSVLHDLCAMIKRQSHCCSWGEILLDLDPHLCLHRPWGGGVWSWDVVPVLGSALLSLPRVVCAEGSEWFPCRNICNVSLGFLRDPAVQGLPIAFTQPPLSVEFCGSIFVYINITLGWLGLLLIISMILL